VKTSNNAARDGADRLTYCLRDMDSGGQGEVGWAVYSPRSCVGGQEIISSPRVWCALLVGRRAYNSSAEPGSPWSYFEGARKKADT